MRIAIGVAPVRLTSLADYAVVVMSAAARAEPGTRLSAALVAEQTGVPLPTVQKLMGRLAQSGLLGSARARGGRFVLARAAHRIRLSDISAAGPGPIALAAG